ncbi:Parvalbumin [Parasponia andersonii]|uniref:Parvalbumin n=1 Tax=Parasponia andersonii TaxID=3476 RepID=A0A2P5AUR6_PARAD|nr:Parvalbumin [Parasponia andersonii]
MEDLRQTALAYYKAATNEIRHVIEEVFKEMDPNDNDYVRFEEFSAYMKTVGCESMSSEEFYDELKQCGNDKLFFDDIITLVYIIQSKRPFCGGKCKKFVKGMYFTCVKCLDDFDHDYDHDHDHEGSTFSVCAQCFADKNFEHRHEEFLDPIVLLHLTRMEALSKQVINSVNILLY